MMKGFFKYMLATIVGVLISTILLFVGFFIFISVLISSAEKEVVIKPNSILHLTLDKPIPERSSDNPFKNFDFQTMKPSVTIGLKDIISNIKVAKDDPNIKGIYLDLSYLSTGFGQVEEIRNAILDFRKSKKFVVSYANYYTHGSYYLASAADSIFINPMGAISFVGLSSEVMFYKGTLDKLNIEAQVIRHGKFKSAVEPFISDKMSAENREQISTLLHSVWGHLLKGISERRKISIDSLNFFADNMTVSNAKAALKYKFVDGIRYKDEILKRLSKLSGVASEKKLELVSIHTYNKAPKNVKAFAKNKIALIYAEGEIVMGDGDDESIGSETLSKAVRDARTDSSIKAVVLRINSPGGSALASDIIWRELALSAKVKPLIVSMGSYAASGGYYIAAPADTILAEPTTLTGSIGVFGVLFNAKGFFNNKLGITTDMVQTNKHGSLGTPFRPLSAEEKAVIQMEIENTYDAFITHVSEGRNISKAAVDSIGQGRIWNALDAKRLGLVDIIGGIDQAIEIAAKKAKIKEYRISIFPKQEDALTSLLSGFSAQMRTKAIVKELGENASIYFSTKSIMEHQGILMRMPYTISIY
jgi:protease-4